MSDIPPGILTKILARLPVMSLLRFRSVSKRVRALIDSSYFVNLHLEQSMRTNKVLAQFSGVGFSTSFRSLNLDPQPTAVELETPFNRSRFHLVLGTCNGLICLCSGPFDRLILLWNPSTRKCKQIPNPVDYPPTYSVLHAVDQLCYDHVNNDYKVVRLTQTCATGVWLDSKFYVYSLKLNAWLSMEQKFPYNDLLAYYKNQGVCVSGAIHWLLNQEPDPGQDYLMVSFDLASQTFQSVPLPECYDRYGDIDLGILEGCLCVVGNRESYNVDVWVMREYGVKESWSKLVALTMSSDMTNRLPSARPIMYLKNHKEVVLEINRQKFLIYDLERKESRNISFRNVSRMSTFVYHESLV